MALEHVSSDYEWRTARPTRLGSRGIANTEETSDESWHFIMIPIRKRKDQFFIEEICVWIFRIVDNERTAEAVWVLSINV